MEKEIQKIISLLKGLSDCQCDRLVKCIRSDEGLLVCIGKSRLSVLYSVRDIRGIIDESNCLFCTEMKENPKFTSTFKSVVYRIIAPEDNMRDFLDFRSENWPEE